MIHCVEFLFKHFNSMNTIWILGDSLKKREKG